MATIPQSRSIVLSPIRTPGGRTIGSVVQEGPARVFERRISETAREKVRYHANDAWPLGDGALRDVERWNVATLRYIVRGEGLYEVALDTFLKLAIPLDFPNNPERQFVLPRSVWHFTPSEPGRTVAVAEQLLLV